MIWGSRGGKDVDYVILGSDAIFLLVVNKD
jgi:hypothetical protein